MDSDYLLLDWNIMLIMGDWTKAMLEESYLRDQGCLKKQFHWPRRHLSKGSKRRKHSFPPSQQKVRCSSWMYSSSLNCMCQWSSISIVYSTCEQQSYFNRVTAMTGRLELPRIQCIYWSPANDIEATYCRAGFQREE